MTLAAAGPSAYWYLTRSSGAVSLLLLTFAIALGVIDVRRLSSPGYYVLLPNLYYRSAVEELGPYIGEAHTATRQQLMQLMGTLNIPMVMEDTDALLAFARRDGAASKGPMGCVGYCMSGRYAINAAVRAACRMRLAERSSV